MVDIVGVAFVSITIMLSAAASFFAFRNYRYVGTEFFKYGACACINLLLMSIGYLFPTLLDDPMYFDIVYIGQLSFTSFGIVALGCFVDAIENVKDIPDDSVINSAYIITGAVIAVRMLPGEYSLQWTSLGWNVGYGLLMLLFAVFLFLFILFSVSPPLYRVWARIGETGRYDSLIRLLFLAFVVAVGWAGTSRIGAGTLPSVPSIVPLSPNVAPLIFIEVVLLLVIILFVYHPTIFFASTKDIIELQLYSREAHEVRYRFRFNEDAQPETSGDLSVAHDKIRQIFQQILESKEQLQSIRLQSKEILAYRGQMYDALLVVEKGSDLYTSLLRLSLREIENQESVLTPDSTQISSKIVFEAAVRKYFQFALPSS